MYFIETQGKQRTESRNQRCTGVTIDVLLRVLLCYSDARPLLDYIEIRDHIPRYPCRGEIMAPSTSTCFLGQMEQIVGAYGNAQR
jgi:hypothetical protein